MPEMVLSCKAPPRFPSRCPACLSLWPAQIPRPPPPRQSRTSSAALPALPGRDELPQSAFPRRRRAHSRLCSRGRAGGASAGASRSPAALAPATAFVRDWSRARGARSRLALWQYRGGGGTEGRFPSRKWLQLAFCGLALASGCTPNLDNELAGGFE